MNVKEKKQEIITIACELFSRYGYEKTTMDDIGSRVGLNKASLYYYYKNKENIFSEVVRIELSDFLVKIDKNVKSMNGYKDKILTFVKGKFDFFHNLINVNNLSMETLLSIQPLFKKLYGKVCESEIHYMSDILNKSVKSGEIRECDTKRIAAAINALVDAVKIKGLQENKTKFLSAVDFKNFVEEIVYTTSLILDGLRKK